MAHVIGGVLIILAIALLGYDLASDGSFQVLPARMLGAALPVMPTWLVSLGLLVIGGLISRIE